MLYMKNSKLSTFEPRGMILKHLWFRNLELSWTWIVSVDSMHKQLPLWYLQLVVSAEFPQEKAVGRASTATTTTTTSCCRAPLFAVQKASGSKRTCQKPQKKMRSSCASQRKWFMNGLVPHTLRCSIVLRWLQQDTDLQTTTGPAWNLWPQNALGWPLDFKIGNWEWYHFGKSLGLVGSTNDNHMTVAGCSWKLHWGGKKMCSEPSEPKRSLWNLYSCGWYIHLNPLWKSWLLGKHVFNCFHIAKWTDIPMNIMG